LEPTTVRQELSVDTLSLESTPEEDVGSGHDDVIDNTTSGNQVDQPGENFVGSAANLEERQARETHDEDEAVDWNTALGALAEESRCATFDSHTVETAGCAVGVSVTSTEN
jgi:hypothetical protein